MKSERSEGRSQKKGEAMGKHATDIVSKEGGGGKRRMRTGVEVLSG